MTSADAANTAARCRRINRLLPFRRAALERRTEGMRTVTRRERRVYRKLTGATTIVRCGYRKSANRSPWPRTGRKRSWRAALLEQHATGYLRRQPESEAVL